MFHYLRRFCRRLFCSPKQTRFVSELDTFLAQVRARTPLSVSQQQEIAKNQAIADKRDHKSTTDNTKLWSEF